MGQIIVRNLDDAVIARLKARARLAGKSLEQTVREALTSAAEPDDGEVWEEIDRIRASLGPVSLDPTDLVARERDAP